jgi:hypothetical protein
VVWFYLVISDGIADMKFFVALVFALLTPLTLNAGQDTFDAETFALNYFDAWSATQSPQAKTEDIERYLALLTDDVGHQHLPYDPDGERDPQGKINMREGMTYYLGSHMEYQSSLKGQLSGFDVVVIKYESYVKGKHPQTGELIEKSSETVEVLELENGKVSVIRKYSR